MALPRAPALHESARLEVAKVKPATHKQTLEIVAAYVAGTLKAWATSNCMTYHCAMMRISRFRRERPTEYARLVKC